MFSELYRILIARESRKIKNESFSQMWHNGGRSVGYFFTRAYEKAERVHLATVARGYNDKTKVYSEGLRIRIPDVAFILLTASTLITYLWI
jgi:cobalt/nickel transport system permease protein